MTPFEVYHDYLALKNHFNNPKYDYFKYGGKGSASLDSFERRKDKFFFEKLAKHRDPHGLMVSNFVESPKVWIRDIAYSTEAESVYTEWVRRNQAVVYTVREDLKKLDSDFDKNFVVTDKQHPKALKLLMSGSIAPETACALTDLTGCMKHWERELSGDPVWEEVGTFIKKYCPFVKYDRAKLKREVVDFFSD